MDKGYNPYDHNPYARKRHDFHNELDANRALANTVKSATRKHAINTNPQLRNRKK